ncbi:hypothetical protein [Euzebya tangerina]|uniref:hypothetical protein n=1 Tax=Euzebya tangerina TaxID=591198 RepID=UPI00196A6AFB|nr:hypothetical protein [Euzebya tangerina]
MDANETITFNPGSGRAAPGSGPGDLTDQLIETDWWTDQMIVDAGIPIIDVPFVSVGGGIGSFVMVDYLRVAGVPPEQIKVLTNIDRPYQTYKFLCKNSQIPEHERLRSDSAATPDNIWGFPGYAIREGWTDKSLKPWLNVFVEPVAKDFYTPRAGDVFTSMDREAARIRWSSMVDKGQVRMVRRRQGGGYYTILTPPQGTSRTKRIAYRSTWVHVSVGYPALRYLKDLQTYRETHQDFRHVVNAYEPHEHVYDDLKRRPGVVMVRGAGIVASRILQRLVDDRDHNGAQTLIIHLFRTYRTEPKYDKKWGGGQQEVRHGWAYQGFNVTKASWGGQHRFKLLELEGQERKEFLDYIGGGAHTPRREDWREQIDRGLSQGFYRQHVGTVDTVEPGENGDGVMVRVSGQDGSTQDFPVRYVIDCTGLVGKPQDHRLLNDLMTHGGAGENVMGRLDCERNFEVRGAQSQPGKIYAGGAATAGAYYGGVDSFLGLQYTAQQIYLDLVKTGFCKKIGVGRSLSQWLKWANNTQI